MSSVESRLDTVTIVIDGHFQNCLELVKESRKRPVLPNVLFTPANGDTFTPVDADLFHALGTRAYWMQETVSFAPGEVKKQERRLAKIKKLFTDETRKVMFASMAQARHQLVILLNTPGGSVIAMETVKKYITHTRSLGGDVYGLGCGKLASAGAMTFLDTDDSRRYVTVPNTHLMFHLATSARAGYWDTMKDLTVGEADAFLGMTRDAGIRVLKEKLVGAARKDVRATLYQRLNDEFEASPVGTDTVFTFTPEEAEQLWGVHLMQDSAAFRQTYTNILRPGISRDDGEALVLHSYRSPPLQSFWPKLALSCYRPRKV